MIDRVKFRFERIFGKLQPGTSCRAYFSALKGTTPYITSFGSDQSGDHRTPIWIVRFKCFDHRWCDVVFIETEPGHLRLASIDVTPATLLWGHNGRVIKSHFELALAMTRLVHIVTPLLEPSSAKRLFRLFHGIPNWSIASIELFGQFSDPGREVIKASHLCRMKNFVEKPMITPGESMTFKSEELQLKLYAKDLEVAKKTKGLDVLEPVTRIEATLRTNRALAKALGVETKDGSISTAPFTEVITALQRSVDGRLVGALDETEGTSLRKLSRRARDIIAQYPSPANLHASLHEDCAQLGRCAASRLRREVFDHLAAGCPLSLHKLLQGDIEDLSVDVCNPIVEDGFAYHITNSDWPIEADPEIAETFSEVLLAAS